MDHMPASWYYGMRLTGTSWPMSTSCGRSHNRVPRQRYDWKLPDTVKCPFSIWRLTERWGRQSSWNMKDWWEALRMCVYCPVFCSSSLQLWAVACMCTVFWPEQSWPTGRLPMILMFYTPCCCLTGMRKCCHSTAVFSLLLNVISSKL